MKMTLSSTPRDFIARIIAPKAQSDLNCCILFERQIAKCPPLSTGTVKSKRFDFTLDDDNFEEHTQGFVPHEWFWVSSTWKKEMQEASTVAFMASVLAGEIKPLGRWQAVAFATRKTGPIYVDSLLGTNCKSATHNPRFQRFKLPAHFQGGYFW